MLCSGALPPRSPGHEGDGGLAALQSRCAAAERTPSPGWPEAACGSPLWPRERGPLRALGDCSGGHQAAERVCSSPQDPCSQVKDVSDMK